MIDAIFSAWETQVQLAEQAVAERRGVSKVDPVADGMDWIVGLFKGRLKELEKAAEFLTPAEYAEAMRPREVTEQTVRNWCRWGWLAGAEHTPNGWRIPRGAKPERRPRQARPSRRRAP